MTAVAEVTPASPPPFRARFPELDSVRGVAFLIVVISHTGNARDLPTRGLGQFGVWLFFVLSAFLLSYPFFAEPALVKDRRAWASYAGRRLRRIFPPLLAGGVAFHFFRGWDWPTVTLNLLCLRGTEGL